MAVKRTNDGVRRWREERGETTGRIRARGTLPFDPIYTQGEGVLSTAERNLYGPKRRFYLERRLDHVLDNGDACWITVERAYQPDTLEGCRNSAQGRDTLRVVVLTSPGVWAVDVPPRKPKTFFSERARLAWEATH